jgi:hypothetical protein
LGVKKRKITHMIGNAFGQQLATVWSCSVRDRNGLELELDRKGGLYVQKEMTLSV